MTTFFHNASAKSTLDSWSVRIASYRTVDIASIQRVHAPASTAAFTPAQGQHAPSDRHDNDRRERAEAERGRPALIAA